ncbi:branched-chain amino acid ABC transporter permease [Pseudooceanicola sp. LIPI14-2-Ac024]|uniref:branched-chain amino acid ABC transporter permease n=1 Tax=Pseudooceanicola sp. LIPI14-2-Ac024 TaxID=3344875 RepID=UPI0035CEE918
MFQFLIDTIIRALDLALIAVALSGVYSLIKFPNVALVQYSVTGAFVGMMLQQAGLPLTLALPVSAVLVGLLAVVFNVLLFERLLEEGSPIALIGSLALSMILSAVFLLAFGPTAYRFELPVAPAMRVLGARVTVHQLSTLAITVAALGGFAAILFLTRLGREMRATATNAVLAAASGIDTRRVINATVFLSGVLAALGGMTLAMRGSVSIDLGTQMLLPVFAAAILGGLGNALGAVAGALVISAAETFVTNTNFGPLVGSDFLFLPASYAQTVSFGILILFLLFRPSGLFTSEVNRV